MEQNIYLDVYFGFNFLMDFFVLFLTRIIIRNNRSIIRISPAAAMGAMYAVIILIMNAQGLIMMLVTYLVMAELMLIIAFGRTDVRNRIKRLCVLYGVTFLVSGLVNAAYYGTNLGKNLVQLANTDAFGNISVGMVLCIMLIVGASAPTISCRLRKNIKISRNIYQVLLEIGTEKISVRALCDTGNSLVEPITKKPVSVIEENSLKSLNRENMHYLMVPYNSVGKQHGLMCAFVADSLTVNGRGIEKAIIGIHEGKLSQNKKYEMILHPDIIESKEN